MSDELPFASSPFFRTAVACCSLHTAECYLWPRRTITMEINLKTKDGLQSTTNLSIVTVRMEGASGHFFVPPLAHWLPQKRRVREQLLVDRQQEEVHGDLWCYSLVKPSISGTFLVITIVSLYSVDNVQEEVLAKRHRSPMESTNKRGSCRVEKRHESWCWIVVTVAVEMHISRGKVSIMILWCI